MIDNCGRLAPALALMVACACPVQGQSTVPSLSLSRAASIVAAALAEAEGRGWRVSVAVADPAGDLVAFGRSDGVAPVTGEIAIGKARTSARLRLPTGFLEDRAAGGQVGFLAVDGMIPLRGGVPIVIDGALIGAVAVSGRSGEDDEALARFAAATGQFTTRGALHPGAYAITNVHVVPMTGGTVVRDAVVVVRDGRIAAVERAGDLTLPDDLRRIDGAGGYLLPGLADMHTHLYSDSHLPDELAPAELGVMLANGVTTIRLMAGTPEQLELRQAVRTGAVLGPQIWAAGPMFSDEAGDNTRVVTSAEDARSAVREVADAGYDFVKVTFGVTGAVYDAVVEEAAAVGIPVVGHVEPDVGVLRAVEAGQQLEHLDAYFEGALAEDAPMRGSVTQYGAYRPENWASLDHLDPDKLQDLARTTAEAGVWVGPTLEVFNRAFGDPLTDEELRATPGWAYIPEDLRDLYMRSRERYWAQPVPRAQRLRYAEIRKDLVRMIHDAGGRILAGSDTPELLMAYGFTLHRELEALVNAGLSAYEALETATRNPAEFLGASRDFGTIEPGKRADLLLVAGNPLVDIRNTREILGVGSGGAWLDRARLDQLLEEGRRAIQGR